MSSGSGLVGMLVEILVSPLKHVLDSLRGDSKVYYRLFLT